jgi:hypothetical protein
MQLIWFTNYSSSDDKVATLPLINTDFFTLSQKQVKSVFHNEAMLTNTSRSSNYNLSHPTNGRCSNDISTKAVSLSTLGFFFQWRNGPQWARTSSLSRLHDLRYTTLGRTPLDEWSARRRDLHLTTHNTHKRHTHTHTHTHDTGGIRTCKQACERPQTHALDSAAMGIGLNQALVQRLSGTLWFRNKKHTRGANSVTRGFVGGYPVGSYLCSLHILRK